MSYPQVDHDSYHYLWSTFLGTMFCLFFLQEFLERKCGLGIAIRLQSSIEKFPNSPVTQRLTKSLDKHGRFRIQIRSSIEILKLSWKISECIIGIIILILWPEWYIDHFYYMIPETRRMQLYLHAVSSMMAFYVWEIFAQQYSYRLNKSALIHHTFTIIAAMSILMDRFNPFGTWYAIVGVCINWPTSIMLFIKARLSYKYPKCTQMGFKFLSWYYLFLTSVPVIGGEIILFINAYWGYGKGKVPIMLGILIIIACIGWVNDVCIAMCILYLILIYMSTFF